jgi:uncharacterized membrane protein
MWSRPALKERAKAVLSKTYWMAFLVTFVGAIITAGINYTLNINRNSGNGAFNYNFSNLNGYVYNLFHNTTFLFMFLGILGFASFILFVIRMAYTFFVAQPVEVGKARFFLSNRRGETDFAKLFSSFKKGIYIDIVKGMAWRYLFNFLWFLLFIIPGIVKWYAYSMTPYILADNPNIGYDRALKLSMKMTDGHKADLFILQLSFIGWYLLGIICCFIGVLFVNPYYEASFAEAYGFLRKKAFENGFCTPNELHLIQGDYVADNR